MPAARTKDAAKMVCAECTHGARCSSTPLKESNVFSTGNDVIDEVDVETTVECSCDHFSCTGIAERPLCGTDGATYRSECHLRREACLQQKDIYKLHDGDCSTQRKHGCVCTYMCVCVCVCVCEHVFQGSHRSFFKVFSILCICQCNRNVDLNHESPFFCSGRC